ncbi:hypothetical protein BU14_1843s0001 [Porphyra umbilicalis]|uniref:Uncharacterized protein n=1 Tax=Porphyra umbilicalis TaxID=2786 RepID=A0A1X6NKI6_PORUM|nr:hypothetical protein BU14_1843s0001 [Porphyra umbilicalis]|eukprot:OSX69114.1 hypothetical protein BU14_1843s0001 [Porphyra umbilicalis]
MIGRTAIAKPMGRTYRRSASQRSAASCTLALVSPRGRPPPGRCSPSRGIPRTPKPWKTPSGPKPTGGSFAAPSTSSAATMATRRGASPAGTGRRCVRPKSRHASRPTWTSFSRFLRPRPPQTRRGCCSSNTPTCGPRTSSPPTCRSTALTCGCSSWRRMLPPLRAPCGCSMVTRTILWILRHSRRARCTPTRPTTG